MKIRLLANMAGPEGSYPAGAVVDLAEDQAADLIAGGYALAYQPAEAAAVAPAETATTEAPQARRVVSKRSKTK